MKKYTYIKRSLFAALLVLAMQVVYAAFSFTGIADEKNRSNKFSLKNLSALSHKSLSFTSLKAGLQYKGIQQPVVAKETINGIEMNSMLRYDNGSTTYIYPYKVKVKASKFKTPSPQH